MFLVVALLYLGGGGGGESLRSFVAAATVALPDLVVRCKETRNLTRCLSECLLYVRVIDVLLCCIVGVSRACNLDVRLSDCVGDPASPDRGSGAHSFFPPRNRPGGVRSWWWNGKGLIG